MSTRTPFAGLELLAPGEPLSTDGFRFTAIDPRIIDRLLQIGAVTHKHDAHAPVENPGAAPTIATAPAGGAIQSDTTVYAAYTWVDEDGGETLPSEAVNVTTRAGLEAPTGAPTLAVDYAAGTLLAANYDYAITVTDGAGGETTIGPAETITVEPGHEKAEVKVTGLKALMEAAGGSKWRLWRRQNGGVWYLMKEGNTAEVVDNGALVGDCTVQPPNSTTAHGTSTITVKVAGGAPARVVSFNLYLSTDAAFPSPCFIANYPLSELGKAIVFTALEALDGEPPLISQSYPGASKIDPDVDMIAWPWKRPVANAAALPAEGNADGDVRVTLDNHFLHIYDGVGKKWETLTGGGGGETLRIIDEEDVLLAMEPKLEFDGAVTVKDSPGSERIIVTIQAGTIIKYEGEWKVGTTYHAGDVVVRKGGSYLALATSTGADPETEPTKWGILAAPGAEGGGGGGGISWKGKWSAVVTYKKNDGVSRGGNSYIATTEPNLNKDPLTNEEVNWNLVAEKGAPGEGGSGVGIKWKGSWAVGTTYAENDLVEEGGSTYISIKPANKGNKPSATPTWWALVAKAGSDGKEGSAGPKGSSGLRYRGEWAIGTSYQQYDVVKKAGIFYVSWKPTPQTGHEPPNVLYWEVFHGEGPSESKVWAVAKPEEGGLPGFTTRINRSEARQQLVGLDLHLDVGEVTITVTSGGAPVAHLTEVVVKPGSPVYVDLTALKPEGEEGKFSPFILADGSYTTIVVVAATGEPGNLSATLHVEHVVWGDV